MILNLPATVEMATPNIYRRPDRMVRPQYQEPRLRHPQRPSAQRPRHRRRRRRAGADGRRRPRRGHALRQRRAHRQCRRRHPGAEPVHPGRRSRPRHLATSTRSSRPSSIATSCRCIRAIPMPASSSSPPSPARIRTRSRRAWRRRPRQQQRPVGSAVSADRSGRSRPQLRGGHPHQQPVRQGRRRLSSWSRTTAFACRAACRSSSARWCRPSPTRPARSCSSREIWRRFQARSISTGNGRYGFVDHQPRCPISGPGPRARGHDPRSRASRGASRARATARSTPLSTRCAHARPSRSSWSTTSEHAIGAGANATAVAYVEARAGDGRHALRRRHRQEHRHRLAPRRHQRGEPPAAREVT